MRAGHRCKIFIKSVITWLGVYKGIAPGGDRKMSPCCFGNMVTFVDFWMITVCYTREN